MALTLAAIRQQVVASVPLEDYLRDAGLLAGGRLGSGLGSGERLYQSCPLHQDQGRSFEIRGGQPAHWRCLDCKVGGTVVELAARYEGLSDWGTLALLDERYRLGLKLPAGLKAHRLLAADERQRLFGRRRLSPLADRS
jgi:hypothetical protein